MYIALYWEDMVKLILLTYISERDSRNEVQLKFAHVYRAVLVKWMCWASKKIYVEYMH